MEVEILSSEVIRPSSSPTSLHLKSFKISVLDQLSPLTYTSLVFFYTLNGTEDPLTLADGLKASLSEALTEFYLLAGRIKDNQIVCNGDGALFMPARVHGAMLEFLKQPSFESLSRLIPCRFGCTESSTDAYAQVAVQLNAFSCGGVALGACFFHKIIDGSTLSSFLKRWAAIAGGCVEKEGGSPDYMATTSLFPQRDLSSASPWLSKRYSPFVGGGRNCRRRFVIDGGAIAELKAEAKSKSVPNPTTVEVVTGFIWKYAMKAARQRSGSRRPSVLTHAVNLRRKLASPLPATSVGNIFWSAVASYDSPNADIELSSLVSLLRQSFAEIDDEYIQKMAGEEGFEAISNWFRQTQELYSEKPYPYGFTSWKNMGLNDVDFGWGKPSWVSFAGPENSVLRNVVVLKEAISGDGIEAWIILDEHEMNILENDQQFLAFASLNPSIHLAQKC